MLPFHSIKAAAAATACAVLATASLTVRGADRFIYHHGGAAVILDSGGELAVFNGLQRRLRVHFFVWRDDWVYRPLTRGRETRPAGSFAAGGWQQSGRWRGPAEELPIDYTLSVEPAGNGLVLSFSFEKTDEIDLTDGLWCRLEPEPGFTFPRRLSAEPGGSGLIGKTFNELSETLQLDLDSQLRVGIDFLRPCRWRTTRVAAEPIIEINLFPDNPAIGRRIDCQLLLNIGPAAPPPAEPSPAPLSFGAPEIMTASPRCNEPVEFRLALVGDWHNPYDPRQVDVQAEIRPPEGDAFRQFAFYLVPFTEESTAAGDLWRRAAADGEWRLRFTPRQAGSYRLRWLARDRHHSVPGGVTEVVVSPGPARGFIGSSTVDPRYLSYANGDSCFLIGHNMPIYRQAPPTTTVALARMAAHGENCWRVWMSSDSLGLEWEDRPGRYRQESAARLDALLTRSAEIGINVVLCLDTHHDFDTYRWDGNPYNQRNGGPCQRPRDWFVEPEARRLYQQRLRYLVARWGASTNLVCWELGNEFEGWPETPTSDVLRWHREMAGYLRQIDAHHHPVSSSWWNRLGETGCWTMPEIGIIQTHCYMNAEVSVAETVGSLAAAQHLYYEKPNIFAEFGIDSAAPRTGDDPQGWALHNAMWASLAGGCASTAMPWWHADYIEQNNLYFHFAAMSRFVADLPFGKQRMSRFEDLEVAFADRRTRFADIALLPVSVWGRPAVSRFRIEPDRELANADSLQEFLHGSEKRSWRNPPVFEIEYPRAGRFVVSVGRVSQEAMLRIWLDDTLVAERFFPAGEGYGRASHYDKKWQVWKTEYNVDVAIDVPPGRHRLRVANDGKDWLRVNSYVFEGCRLVAPEVMVSGMRGEELSFLWLHNLNNVWYRIARGEVLPSAPIQVTVMDFPDGVYQLDWWDTWQGHLQFTARTTVTGGRLELLPGELRTDIAVKIRRLKDN